MGRITDVLGELAKLGAVAPPPPPVAAAAPPATEPARLAPEPPAEAPPAQTEDSVEAKISALSEGFSAPVSSPPATPVEPEVVEEDEPKIDFKTALRQMKRSIAKMELELDTLKEQVELLENA